MIEQSIIMPILDSIAYIRDNYFTYLFLKSSGMDRLWNVPNHPPMRPRGRPAHHASEYQDLKL